MSLPVFFIILTSAALLAALTALFSSLRAAFGGTSLEPVTVAGLPDRAALEDEKNSLLRALKDLEYENEVGKIADADYQRLDRAYRMRAKQVLTDLDRDLGPYLSQAEALVFRSLGEGKTPFREPGRGKKAKKKATAEVRAVPAPDPGASEASESEEPTSEESSTEAEVAASTEDAADVLVCAKCTTKNDPDARFCKRCASPLGSPEPEASV